MMAKREQEPAWKPLFDAYVPVLEHYGERLERLETEVMVSPGRSVIHRIHEVKRDLLVLRRALALDESALASDSETVTLADIEGPGTIDGHNLRSGNAKPPCSQAAQTTPPDAPEKATHFPASLKGEAWRRKQLRTALASWAELRHDTILSAKQSYTSGVACEFPDAYVGSAIVYVARHELTPTSRAGLPRAR